MPQRRSPHTPLLQAKPVRVALITWRISRLFRTLWELCESICSTEQPHIFTKDASRSSDGYDVAVQFVPYLTYSSPYTSLILSFALVSFLAMIPLVNIIPMRTTCLVIGLLPFFATHPFTQHTLLPVLLSFGAALNSLRERALRFIDDDKLEDKHWRTELREVELWENERWIRGTSSASDDATKAEGTWAKNNLKLGERKAWTRGRDGWSGVGDDGSGEVRYARSKRSSIVV